MKKTINSVKVARIKTTTLQLRKNYQIPYYLAYLIYQLDPNNTSEKYLLFLLDLVEEFLRVKGYYKKHKDIEQKIDDFIKEQERSFIRVNCLK